MSKGPGYTVHDLAFWGGLILGTSGTHVLLVNLPAYRDVLDQMGLLPFARIVTLGLSVLVGVALGGAAGSMLRRYQASKKAAAQERHQEDYRKDYHEERDEHDPRR
jgi:hypothetical protein